MSRLRFLVGLLWLIVGSGSVIWVFAAANLRSPYLLAVREGVFWLWVLAGLMGAMFLIFRGSIFFHVFIRCIWSPAPPC